MRRDLRHVPAGLLCAALLLSAQRQACAFSDSRESVEPAPVERLGPPEVIDAAGARVTPSDVELRVSRTRRSVRVGALFAIEAPPGPLRLTVPSSQFQVEFTTDAGDAGGVTSEQVEPIVARQASVEDVRIDPRSGRIYARGPAAPPLSLYRHTIAVNVPASGLLLLRATAVLSSGFDRVHWRRQVVEQTHGLHRRSDFFVYEFAVVGPGGPIRLQVPVRVTASARMVDGVLRAAAAEPRPFPLAATLGLGVGLTDPQSEGPAALLRGSLDLLLPYGDALSLAGEGGTAFTGGHHAALGLLYQLYSPWLPFSLLPVGGHLDFGAAVDLWPALRAGPRLGLGLNLSMVGLWVGADLFPERAPPLPGESGPDHYLLHYRLAVLATVGL